MSSTLQRTGYFLTILLSIFFLAFSPMLVLVAEGATNPSVDSTLNTPGDAVLNTPPAPQPTTRGFGIKFENPLAVGSIGQFFEAVLNIVIIVAFPVVVLAIIYGGFMLVSARGNEEKLTKGKQALIWAIIGGLIVLGAKVLVTAISGTVDQLLSAIDILIT